MTHFASALVGYPCQVNVLVLGGTVFVGRHFVEAALHSGHRVTLLHRGQHGADLFPEAEHVFCDRDGGLDAIGDRRFDWIVDTCGYVPRVVRQSVERFSSTDAGYLFVSTISVYDDPDAARIDEGSQLSRLEDPTTEVVDGATYGGLKVLCEEAVAQGFPERALIIRPGLIAGPHDPTNRFTYWVDRVARGGRVLAPDNADQPLQLVDVRDLAAFMLRAVERGLTGVFNVTGPQTTFGAMLRACGTARLEILDHDFLRSQAIELWQDLPLALADEPGTRTLMRTDSSRAHAAGFSCRPLEETAQATRRWSAQSPAADPRFGLSPEREKATLKAWDSRISEA